VRALVVDDNESQREALSAMLGRWGMVPHVVADADAAMAALDHIDLSQGDLSQGPVVMLIDINLAESDGMHLIHRVRSRSGPLPTLVMMLTSSGQRVDAQRCRAVGISSYIVKPIRSHDLRDLLVRVCDIQVASQPPTAASRRQHAPDVQDVGLNILLAEDNVVNQMVMQRLLAKRGHRVVVAMNGQVAVEACQRERFHLVFMDVQMPEMDGLEATRTIRRGDSSNSHTPIVALTAHAMSGDRERCLQVGMDDYITKPINPKELDEILERYTSGVMRDARSA
jgi:two-component system, sensor histidine kinase and response regulator